MFILGQYIVRVSGTLVGGIDGSRVGKGQRTLPFRGGHFRSQMSPDYPGDYPDP